jgi:hypothetical protein
MNIITVLKKFKLLNNSNNFSEEPKIKNMAEILKKLVEELDKIGWIEFDNLFMEGLRLIDIMNNNKKIEENFFENLIKRNTVDTVYNDKTNITKNNNETQTVNINFGKYNFNSFDFGNNKYSTPIKYSLDNLRSLPAKNKNINNYMKYLQHNTLYNLRQKSYRIEVITWIEYWILMLKSYHELKIRYESKYQSPFTALKEEFNHKDWKMFTSWLDIYSLQLNLFKNKKGYTFYNNISKNLTKYIEIPGFTIMKIVRGILLKSKWKCYI